MKYLFDNCISYRYVDMLKALEVDAVHLTAHFPANAADVDIFKRLRELADVFVTADLSQTSREPEARGLKEAGVTALFLGRFWSKMADWDQAAWLISKWPRIDGFVNGAARGTVAEVKRNGKSIYFPL